MASGTGEPVRPEGIVVTMRATQLAAANRRPPRRLDSAREWRTHA
jgi:hypothetical protein